MTEEQKELLKEKLKQLLEEKLNTLTTKFENDINTIEVYKYSYFDNVVLPYRELMQKETEKKEEKEKPNESKEKEEKSKKVEEGKTFKKIKPLPLKDTHITKTPLKATKKRDLGFKEKTEILPKKSNKIFSDKKKSEPIKTQTNEPKAERMKKKNLTTIDVTKKSGAGRPSKTPLNKRGRKTDDDKDTAPKAKTIRATAVKTNTTKRFTGKGKPTADKKGKKNKDKKKTEKGEKENIEEKKEEIVEEKKEIVLKDKSIIKIPDDLKDNNALINIYFVLKGKYLTNKEKYNLILSNSKIFKSFGNDIKFLLDDKKQEIKTKINELETFLNNYGDLESYLLKEFSPSKTAQNSLNFVKKEEIENIIKKGDIPSEIINIFKILFYIFDIPFDENLEGENLLNNFIQEVMDKNGIKDLKTLALNYISKNKDLNITKEKIDKINAIISLDEKVLSSVDIAKICRSISYSTLLIRECIEFMNSKTLDDVPIYELKLKNKMLQEYKNKLAILENNGVEPKKEDATTEIKEIEKKIESTNGE